MSRYQSFADIYDVWVESAPVCEANLPFYVEEYRRVGKGVVELGVGNGRILIEAARRGVSAIGVDNDLDMLELAAERIQAAGVEERVSLQHADMRDFRLSEPARLISIPFHSIGHLLTLEDKRQTMQHIRTQLRADGKLIFDHFVFSEDYARSHQGKPTLRAEFNDIDSGQDCLLWVTSNCDFPSQIIRIVSCIERLDVDGQVTSRQYQRMNFSWLEPQQAEIIIRQSGFTVEAVYGDFERQAVTAESSHRIWVVSPAS